MQKINLRLMFVFIVTLLLISPLAQARSAPLYNPEPISVPAGKSLEQVKTAIRSALLSRGWEGTAASANHIVGTLHVRKHTAVIDIHYDTKEIKISYKDSNQLNYEMKDNKPFIHPNYNGWIQKLEKDIRVKISDR